MDNYERLLLLNSIHSLAQEADRLLQEFLADEYPVDALVRWKKGKYSQTGWVTFSGHGFLRVENSRTGKLVDINASHILDAAKERGLL